MSTPAIILNSSPAIWGDAADAARRQIELARIGLGVGDELGNRLGRKRRIAPPCTLGTRHDARDRRDVADEIEIELVVERRVDGVRRIGQEAAYSRPAGARTTASVPMLLPAPGRFSMMNGWPSRSDSHCPIRRATMSVGPPAASRRRCAPAATDRFAPARCATRSGARQRPRPDAEIDGVEASWHSLRESGHSLCACNPTELRALANRLRPFHEARGRDNVSSERNRRRTGHAGTSRASRISASR